MRIERIAAPEDAGDGPLVEVRSVEGGYLVSVDFSRHRSLWLGPYAEPQAAERNGLLQAQRSAPKIVYVVNPYAGAQGLSRAVTMGGRRLSSV